MSIFLLIMSIEKSLRIILIGSKVMMYTSDKIIGDINLLKKILNFCHNDVGNLSKLGK